MTTISDIHKSVSEMTNDDLYERLRELRQSRRTKKASKKSTTSPKKAIDLDAAISKMSPQARMRLIEQLEKEGERSSSETS